MGQRVNSIFGEGVNPKLRKVRDGIDLLGWPSEVLLQHGRHRIVYGVSSRGTCWPISLEWTIARTTFTTLRAMETSKRSQIGGFAGGQVGASSQTRSWSGWLAIGRRDPLHAARKSDSPSSKMVETSF